MHTLAIDKTGFRGGNKMGFTLISEQILQFPASDFIQDLFIEMKLLDCGHTHQAGNLEMSLTCLLLEHLRQENDQN